MTPAPHRTLIGQDLKYALRAIRRNGSLPYLIAIVLLTATATTANVIPALRAARRPLWKALRTP